MAKLVAHDWERLYAHPIYLLETFVDRERFGGTCYRAANWIVVGETTGRGKDSTSWNPTGASNRFWRCRCTGDFVSC